MDVLTTLLLGGLVALVTQIMKKVAPAISPLYWVACLAIIGGAIYGIVIPMIPTEVIEKIVFSFSTSIGIYEVLKSFVKKA